MKVNGNPKVAIIVNWENPSVVISTKSGNVTMQFDNIEELDSFMQQLGILKEMWEKKEER